MCLRFESIIISPECQSKACLKLQNSEWQGLFLCIQVFVANPNKTQPILDILLKNQTKLIEFLSKFQNDRAEDEQFSDEKTYLIKQIRDLKRPTPQDAWEG